MNEEINYSKEHGLEEITVNVRLISSPIGLYKPFVKLYHVVIAVGGIEKSLEDQRDRDRG